MKTMHRFAVSAVAVAVLLGMGGCSGMSTQDKNTAIGAGVGGVAAPSLRAAAPSEPSAVRRSVAS